MPAAQALLTLLNKRFGYPDITQFVSVRDFFARPRPLSDIAREVRTAPPELIDTWVRFLDSMPRAIQEALRAVMYSALSSEPPVAITFAWMPGYDFELTLTQSMDTKQTRGGITVLLRSRYPDDRHPLASS